MSQTKRECELPCIHRGQFDAGCRCDTYTTDEWRSEYERVSEENTELFDRTLAFREEIRRLRNEIDGLVKQNLSLRNMLHRL